MGAGSSEEGSRQTLAWDEGGLRLPPWDGSGAGPVTADPDAVLAWMQAAPCRHLPVLPLALAWAGVLRAFAVAAVAPPGPTGSQRVTDDLAAWTQARPAGPARAALDHLAACARQHADGLGPRELAARLRMEALRLDKADAQAWQACATAGVTALPQGGSVLTVGVGGIRELLAAAQAAGRPLTALALADDAAAGTVPALLLGKAVQTRRIQAVLIATHAIGPSGEGRAPLGALAAAVLAKQFRLPCLALARANALVATLTPAADDEDALPVDLLSLLITGSGVLRPPLRDAIAAAKTVTA